MLKNKSLLSVCAILALFLFGSSYAMAGSSFKIKSAKWDKKRGQLTVSGKGLKGATISLLYNDEDKTEIASQQFNGKSWKFREKNLSPVPCRIRVEQSDGKVAEKAIKKAPANCSDSGIDTESSGSDVKIAAIQSFSDSFKIEEAKWNSEYKRLIVKGKGDEGKTVSLLYAGSLTEIASKQINDDDWKFGRRNLSPVPCRVRAEQSDGNIAEKDVKYAPADCDNGAGSDDPRPLTGNFTVLAANDLGMHCADQDYRIFSILPPYNVLNAQVIKKGREPRILSADDGVTVTYSAILSNVQNPAGPELPPLAYNSITTTSQNAPDTFKSNFWDPSETNPGTNGFATYQSLYPSGVLGAFPFEADLGLPAPDLVLLYFGPDRIPGTGDELLEAHQTAMPGIANVPQHFKGYVKDLPFFVDLPPIGYTVENFKRFTAEGIPILPMDDQGRENPYPLMRVEARDETNNAVLAQVDVVLPVASEADCQGCHASQKVCSFAPNYTLVCDDIANTNPGVTFIDYDQDNEQWAENGYWSEPAPPGETPQQQVINAAKINILRLHDGKHPPITEDKKLDFQRNIVCASCHYSPALDLAHLGPNDDNGKEQTQHISMSRAMHASHGNLNKQPQFDHLFPDMPPPGDPGRFEQEQILQEACYNCHPGKRTKCLRGAMGGGGIVCQDCHGQMAQVGDDFSEGLADDSGLDLDKRVPWASEPKCQSCHVGDVLQVADLQSTGMLDNVSINALDNRGNSDGLRLNMTYKLSDHSSNGGPDNLALLNFSDSRFASNKPLYRLSGGDDGSDKGHGGLSCEGCHGSTHAIWPNANPWANDNKAAMDLQGHTGTLIECSSCHEGDLGLTLKGPHGMHPVGDTKFAREHDDFAKNNRTACQSCHGEDGEGSVLSRAAIDRELQAKEDHIKVSIPKGTPVGCGDCHENKLKNP